MSVLATQILLAIVGLYLLIGLGAAVLLQVRGLKKIDPTTAASPVGFRILITPGLIALWPILLVSWHRNATRPASYPDPEKPVGGPGLIGLQFRTILFLIAIVMPLALIAWFYRGA